MLLLECGHSLLRNARLDAPPAKVYCVLCALRKEPSATPARRRLWELPPEPAAPGERRELVNESAVPPVVISVWEVYGPPPKAEEGRLFFLERSSPSRETFISNALWGSDDEGYALAVERLTGRSVAQHEKEHRRIRIHDRNEQGRLLRLYPG
jgi:hypothetical protein